MSFHFAQLAHSQLLNIVVLRRGPPHHSPSLVRDRGHRPAHTHAHRTIPMPADDGDQYRVIVVAPDSPLPGSPAIDRT